MHSSSENPEPKSDLPMTQHKEPSTNRIRMSTILIVAVLSSLIILGFLYLDLRVKNQWLESRHTSLLSYYEDLQTQNNQLTNDYEILTANYEQLEENNTRLESEYSSLQSQYQSLDDEYNNYQEAYQSLSDQINERRYHSEVEAFITPNDSSVVSRVLSITGGWSDSSDFDEFWADVKAMYLWVRDNVDYRSDGLYPLLPYDPSWDTTYFTEMWQFANETLDLGKGDCEDQEILLCSMIRNYCNPHQWVECVSLESLTSGHVGVQLRVTGDKLVILDPAGSYYSSDIWGNIVFRDLTTEINNWLDYWKPEMGTDVYVDEVFSDYISRTFTSTSEYITWMQNR